MPALTRLETLLQTPQPGHPLGPSDFRALTPPPSPFPAPGAPAHCHRVSPPLSPCLTGVTQYLSRDTPSSLFAAGLEDLTLLLGLRTLPAIIVVSLLSSRPVLRPPGIRDHYQGFVADSSFHSALPSC